MWHHSHQEGLCPVSPEGIISWQECSLGAGGGIPLECRGFQEWHAQLQKGWGRVFLQINQELLNNHVVLWALERSLGTSLTRTLLWFKSKSSQWPEGPRDLTFITSVTQSPHSPSIMLCLSHCPPHCFHTHYTGFYSPAFPLALPLSRILLIGISPLGCCSNVTILELPWPLFLNITPLSISLSRFNFIHSNYKHLIHYLYLGTTWSQQNVSSMRKRLIFSVLTYRVVLDSYFGENEWMM